MKKVPSKKVILIGAVVVALVVALILILTHKKESYRNAIVNAFTGEVSVERKASPVEVFTGLKLQADDAAETRASATMEILADDDKHIFLEENTKIHVNATGSPEKGKITIDLTEGRCLFHVENKLNEEDSFTVETPNASISIRGTKFYVSYHPYKTIVEVLEGVVEVTDKIHNTVHILYAGDSIIIEPDDVAQVISGNAVTGTTTPEQDEEETELAEETDGTKENEEEPEEVVEVTETACVHTKGSEDLVLKETESVEAACERAGKQVYICEECGEKVEIVVPALTHQYEEVLIEATCEADGSQTFTCKNCADYKVTLLPALGHDYVESVDKEATCEVDGRMLYTCSRCGNSYASTIRHSGHHYVTKSVVAPTCTKEGVTTISCTNCGDTYTEKKEMISHDYVSGKCTICGGEEPRRDTGNGGSGGSGGSGACSAYRDAIAAGKTYEGTAFAQGGGVYHMFSGSMIRCTSDSCTVR